MKEKIKDLLLTLLAWSPEIAIVIFLLLGKYKVAFYIFSALVITTLIIMYTIYKLMLWSGIILHSAGKMKTGNDLSERVEDTLKNEDLPNFFQFYWRLFLKYWRNR